MQLRVVLADVHAKNALVAAGTVKDGHEDNVTRGLREERERARD